MATRRKKAIPADAVYIVDLKSLPVVRNGVVGESVGEEVVADHSKDLAIAQKDREARNRLLAYYGLDIATIIRKHRENLDAVSFIAVGQGNDRKLIKVPDFKTRQKAVEQAEKLLGMLPSDEEGDSGRPLVLNLRPETVLKVERLKGGPLTIVDVESEPQTSDEMEIGDERPRLSGSVTGDEHGSGAGLEADLEAALLARRQEDAGAETAAGDGTPPGRDDRDYEQAEQAEGAAPIPDEAFDFK